MFARAKAEGYLLTMHCDVDIPGSIEHIATVIKEIGVARIDHGTNIVEDPELVRLIAERGIGLTSCPISNTWVSDGLKVALIKQLAGEGVKVTVNSDDPAYFGGYIAETTSGWPTRVMSRTSSLPSLRATPWTSPGRQRC